MSDVVLVALVGGVFSVIVVVVQAGVARVNSAQHGMVDARVTEVLQEIRDVKADVRTVKADVRDLDAKVDDLTAIDTRRHEENLVRLEALERASGGST